MNGIYLILALSLTNPLDLPRRIAESGPVDSAILVLDHIIDSARGTPLEAQALLLKASIYHQIGDDGRALTVLKGMRRMELPDYVADTAYAMLASMTEDPKQQAEILSEFVRKYPFASTRLNALWNLANLFEFLNMPDSAMMALKAISADYPDFRDTAQVEIGRFRVQLGNCGRAMVLARRHIGRVSTANYVLSLAHLARGDTGLAIALSWDNAETDWNSAALEIGLLNKRNASALGLRLPSPGFDRWPLQLKREWAIATINVGKADTVLKLTAPTLFDTVDGKSYRNLLLFRFYILSEQMDSAMVMVDSLPLEPPFTGYLIKFARRLINMGYPDQAIPILESIYTSGRHYPMDELLTTLHRAYLRVGNYEAAARLEGKMVQFGVPIQRRITLEIKRQIEAYERLFEATGDSTHLRNARKLQALIKDIPTDTSAGRVEELIREEKYQQAFREVDLSRYDLLYRIAVGMLQQGDTLQAYGVLGLIPLTGFKLDHDAFRLRLIAGYGLGKFRRVIDDFNQYQSLYADFTPDTAVWRVVGLSYLALGEYEKSLGWLYPIADTGLSHAIATAFLKLDLPELALRVKDIPSELAVKCALKLGDVEKLKSLNPPTDRNLLRQYLIAIARSDPDFAMKMADSLRVSYIIKGEIAVIAALRNSDVETAVENAVTPLAYYEIGLFYMRHGLLDSAKIYFRKAMENTEQEYALAAFKLGSIYYSQDMAVEAIKYYRMAMSDDSLKPYAIYNLASAFKTLRKKDSAAYYYRLLMKEYADREISLDAEDALAFMLQDAGRPEEALRYWNDLEGELRKYDDEIELKYWKAEALFALNRSREALNYYLMVARSGTGSEWRIIATLKAAKIYAITGRKRQAVELYRKVINMAGPASQFGELAQKELDALKGGN